MISDRTETLHRTLAELEGNRTSVARTIEQPLPVYRWQSDWRITVALCAINVVLLVVFFNLH